MVVVTVYSSQFRNELQRQIDIHQSGAEYGPAWTNLTADSIIERMKRSMTGINVKTFRGPRATLLYYLAGNLAYDGTSRGPIKINETEIAKRSKYDFANTIAHELAHRAGLEHPHSEVKGKFKIALCEPPYVVGEIVEKMCNSAWQFDEYNCCPHIR